MSRCKHENIKITEVIEGLNQKIFDGNKYVYNNEYGNLLYTSVECFDCGFYKRFNKDKTQPKWLKNRIEILLKDNAL